MRGSSRRHPASTVARCIHAHRNHSSSNRLPTSLTKSRPTNLSHESKKCANSSPSIVPNSVSTQPKNWRSTRRIRLSPSPGPHRTRSIQKQYGSRRRSAGTSRSRTAPSQSTTPSSSSTPTVAQPTAASLPERCWHLLSGHSTPYQTGTNWTWILFQALRRIRVRYVQHIVCTFDFLGISEYTLEPPRMGWQVMLCTHRYPCALD